MDKRDSFPSEIIIGVGLVVAAAAVFLVASLARTAGSAAPTLTPPTPLPALSQSPEPSTGPVEAPTTAPTALPTATVVPALLSPIAVADPVAESPLAVVAIPEIAPDFTLPRAGGGTFTLTEQLAQGPLVLVFFQKGG